VGEEKTAGGKWKERRKEHPGFVTGGFYWRKWSEKGRKKKVGGDRTREGA